MVIGTILQSQLELEVGREEVGKILVEDSCTRSASPFPGGYGLGKPPLIHSLKIAVLLVPSLKVAMVMVPLTVGSQLLAT